MEPHTIIIIDDSETARALAADAVDLLRIETGLNFTTIETSTGRDGLQRLREQPGGSVALVVLDIHLPWEDVDGRMLASLIREQFPTLPILPFTGDRDSQTAAQLQALGFPEPVIKPVAPEVLARQMRTVMMGPPAANDVPLQPLLAAQARRMVRLLEHRTTYGLVQLALVAHNHVVLAGLQLILTTAKDAPPLEIVVSGTGRDSITPALQAGRVDLLVTAPDAFEEAAPLAEQYRLPLLIYSTSEEARALLPQPYSLVVGPSPGDVLAEALRATLAGERYREPHVDAALGLSARERTIIQQLMRGATSLQIASAVGLSDDRLRHVIGELYERLGVERQRSALASWGHEARLDRF